MTEIKCQILKATITKYMEDATITTQVGNACAISLPIPTVDGRIVGVFVEARLENYLLIHDGGKAVNELVLQGVKVTDSIKDYFAALARNFGVLYVDEMFQTTGKQDTLEKMVLAVGACSSLAMAQLIGHIAPALEEPTREEFGRALKRWSAKKKFTVSRDVSVKGRRFQHKFDFVASPIVGRKTPIVMSVLSPGSNSLAAAQRFGFHATDLDNTRYEKWPRVVVTDRSEVWSAEAKNIISSCAQIVIEVPTGNSVDVDMVSESLRDIAA